MKTFHVSILYSTANGPLVKTHTLKADSPESLSVQTTFLALYDCRIGEEWVTIEATEVKATVELALAN